MKVLHKKLCMRKLQSLWLMYLPLGCFDLRETPFISSKVPSAGIKSSKNMNIMVGRCHAAHDYKHGLSCGRRGLV